MKKEVPIIGEKNKEVQEAIEAMVERFDPIFRSFTDAVAEIGRRLEIVEATPQLTFPDTINVNVTHNLFSEDDEVKCDHVSFKEETNE